MNEYQIVVARDGKFLFSTDRDHRKERVQSAVDVLQATGLQVTVYTRALSIQRVTVQRVTVQCVTGQFTGVVTC